MRLKGLFFVLVMVLISACGKSQEAKGHGGGGMGGFFVPVVGAPVVAELVQEKVSVLGSLVANEVVEVKSEVEGLVREIKFEEGQSVNAGDVLFIIDRQKMEATLAQAQAKLNIAQATYERMKVLVEDGAVSRQEYDEAASSVAAQRAQTDLIKAQLEDNVIKAPFAGTIGERKVSLGQYISPAMVLTYVVDEDPMKVEFHVPERFLDKVKTGQSISLSVSAYPDEVFSGDVYFIDPRVDPASRTVLVKAKVANDQGRLHAGMFAKLDIVVGQNPQALVIPDRALIPKGNDVFVFVVDAEGKAQMRPVKVGLRLPYKAEILEGLNAGETVIVEGHQKIGPGSPVKAETEQKQDIKS